LERFGPLLNRLDTLEQINDSFVSELDRFDDRSFFRCP